MPSLVLGDETFISWVKDRFFKEKLDQEVTASRYLAPDMGTILREVGLYYDLNPSSMTPVRRGMENEARDVAMYLIRSLRFEPFFKEGGRTFWTESVQLGQ